jgi:hypothetical protein
MTEDELFMGGVEVLLRDSNAPVKMALLKGGPWPGRIKAWSDVKERAICEPHPVTAKLVVTSKSINWGGGLKAKWESVELGHDIKAIVTFIDTGDPQTSMLLTCHKGKPIHTTGEDIYVECHKSGVLEIKCKQ